MSGKPKYQTVTNVKITMNGKVVNEYCIMAAPGFDKWYRVIYRKMLRIIDKIYNK